MNPAAAGRCGPGPLALRLGRAQGRGAQLFLLLALLAIAGAVLVLRGLAVRPSPDAFLPEAARPSERGLAAGASTWGMSGVRALVLAGDEDSEDWLPEIGRRLADRWRRHSRVKSVRLGWIPETVAALDELLLERSLLYLRRDEVNARLESFRPVRIGRELARSRRVLLLGPPSGVLEREVRRDPAGLLRPVAALHRRFALPGVPGTIDPSRRWFLDPDGRALLLELELAPPPRTLEAQGELARFLEEGLRAVRGDLAARAAAAGWDAPRFRLHLSGAAVRGAHLGRLLATTVPRRAGLLLAALMLLLLVACGHWRAGLAAALGLLSCAAFALLVAALWGISPDALSLLVGWPLPLAVAAAACYLLATGYRAVVGRGAPPWEAPARVLQGDGRRVTAVCALLAAGGLSLLLGSSPGWQWFGRSTIAAAAGIFLGTVLLLPALLALFSPPGRPPTTLGVDEQPALFLGLRLHRHAVLWSVAFLLLLAGAAALSFNRRGLRAPLDPAPGSLLARDDQTHAADREVRRRFLLGREALVIRAPAADPEQALKDLRGARKLLEKWLGADGDWWLAPTEWAPPQIDQDIARSGTTSRLNPPALLERLGREMTRAGFDPAFTTAYSRRVERLLHPGESLSLETFRRGRLRPLIEDYSLRDGGTPRLLAFAFQPRDAWREPVWRERLAELRRRHPRLTLGGSPFREERSLARIQIEVALACTLILLLSAGLTLWLERRPGWALLPGLVGAGATLCITATAAILGWPFDPATVLLLPLLFTFAAIAALFRGEPLCRAALRPGGLTPRYPAAILILAALVGGAVLVGIEVPAAQTSVRVLGAGLLVVAVLSGVALPALQRVVAPSSRGAGRS